MKRRAHSYIDPELTKYSVRHAKNFMFGHRSISLLEIAEALVRLDLIQQRKRKRRRKGKL